MPQPSLRIFLLLLFLPVLGLAQQELRFFGKTSLGLSHLPEFDDFGKTAQTQLSIGAEFQLYRLSYGYGFQMLSLGKDIRYPNDLLRNAEEVHKLERRRANTINYASQIRSHRLMFHVLDPVRERAYMGVGAGFHHIPKQLVFDDAFLGTPRTLYLEAQKFKSLIVQVGYTFRRFQFDWTGDLAEQYVMPQSTLSASYCIDLGKKTLKLKEKKTVVFEREEPPTDEEEDQDADFFSLFRADIGYSFWQPLSKQRDAGSVILDLGVQFSVYQNFFAGTAIGLGSLTTGIDTQAKFGARPIFNAPDTSSNALANVRGMSVFAGYAFPVQYPESYFLSIGYGHYWIDQVEFDPNFDPLRKPYFRAVLLRAGVRAGLFSNTLSLYMPTKKVKPFMEFRMSVGLDFFRLR